MLDATAKALAKAAKFAALTSAFAVASSIAASSQPGDRGPDRVAGHPAIERVPCWTKGRRQSSRGTLAGWDPNGRRLLRPTRRSRSIP